MPYKDWYPVCLADEDASIAGLSQYGELCFYRLRNEYIGAAGDLIADPDTLRRRLGYKSVRKFNRGFAELVSVGLVAVRDGRVSFPYADELIIFTPARIPWKPEIIEAVLGMTGGLCTYCRAEVTFGEIGPTQFNIDHKTPVSRGGSNEIENLTPSCRACNLEKRTKTYEEYLEMRGIG